MLELTLIEKQQQWSLERRWNNHDPFTWRVTLQDFSAVYFDNAAQAVSRAEALNARRIEYPKYNKVFC